MPTKRKIIALFDSLTFKLHFISILKNIDCKGLLFLRRSKTRSVFFNLFDPSGIQAIWHDPNLPLNDNQRQPKQ